MAAAAGVSGDALARLLETEYLSESVLSTLNVWVAAQPLPAGWVADADFAEAATRWAHDQKMRGVAAQHRVGLYLQDRAPHFRLEEHLGDWRLHRREGNAHILSAALSRGAPPREMLELGLIEDRRFGAEDLPLISMTPADAARLEAAAPVALMRNLLAAKQRTRAAMDALREIEIEAAASATDAWSIAAGAAGILAVALLLGGLGGFAALAAALAVTLLIGRWHVQEGALLARLRRHPEALLDHEDTRVRAAARYVLWQRGGTLPPEGVAAADPDAPVRASLAQYRLELVRELPGASEEEAGEIHAALAEIDAAERELIPAGSPQARRLAGEARAYVRSLPRRG